MTLWFSATAVTPALVARAAAERRRGLVADDGGAGRLRRSARLSPRSSTSPTSSRGPHADVRRRRARRRGQRCGPGGARCVAGASASALLTGVALAAVYPPAMKMAASWFGSRRGLALGLLIGALTLGKAVPYLMTTLFGDRMALPMLAGLGPGGARRRCWCSPLPPRRPLPGAVSRLRSARHPPHALGFAACGWRLPAIWATCGSSTRCGRGSACIATASFAAAGLGPAASMAGSAAAFLAIGSGAAGCGLAGYYADRLGKARVAGWSLAVERIVLGAHRRRFRPHAGLDLRAGHGVGLRGGRRLGAVLGAGRPSTRRPSTWARRSPSRPRSGSC